MTWCHKRFESIPGIVSASVATGRNALSLRSTLVEKKECGSATLPNSSDVTKVVLEAVEFNRVFFFGERGRSSSFWLAAGGTEAVKTSLPCASRLRLCLDSSLARAFFAAFLNSMRPRTFLFLRLSSRFRVCSLTIWVLCWVTREIACLPLPGVAKML